MSEPNGLEHLPNPHSHSNFNLTELNELFLKNDEISHLTDIVITTFCRNARNIHSYSEIQTLEAIQSHMLGHSTEGNVRFWWCFRLGAVIWQKENGRHLDPFHNSLAFQHILFKLILNAWNIKNVIHMIQFLVFVVFTSGSDIWTILHRIFYVDLKGHVKICCNVKRSITELWFMLDKQNC